MAARAGRVEKVSNLRRDRTELRVAASKNGARYPGKTSKGRREGWGSG